MEAELDPSICWRQAQLSQFGLNMAHVCAAEVPGMVPVPGMRQHANDLEPADRQNNKPSAHPETQVADAGAFDTRYSMATA